MLRARLGWDYESQKREGQGHSSCTKLEDDLCLQKQVIVQKLMMIVFALMIKRKQKKIKLQLTLDNNPDKYDEHWIGDEMKDKKMELFVCGFKIVTG